jgi:endonuclease V-like protein UPF0215 family
MNKPYRNFDLPKQHLDDRHYVPERARTSTEIDRRRTLPSGTILAEHQRDGLHVASQIMQTVEQPEDIAFARGVIAMSGLNAGWYNYAADSPVMRRRLNLPTLADEETDWRETKSGLLTKAQRGLVEAATIAEALASAKADRRSTLRHQQQLGRRLGNVSLQLACIEISSVADSYSPFDVQNFAREQSLQTLEQAREFGDQIGSHPSVAQLADPNSPLAVYWRRTAPNGAFEAYEEAIEEYPRSI